MKSQHAVNFPLSGGCFEIKISGTWTPEEAATMRQVVEHMMQIADMCAHEEVPQDSKNDGASDAETKQPVL